MFTGTDEAMITTLTNGTGLISGVAWLRKYRWSNKMTRSPPEPRKKTGFILNSKCRFRMGLREGNSVGS